MSNIFDLISVQQQHIIRNLVTFLNNYYKKIEDHFYYCICIVCYIFDYLYIYSLFSGQSGSSIIHDLIFLCKRLFARYHLDSPFRLQSHCFHRYPAWVILYKYTVSQFSTLYKNMTIIVQWCLFSRLRWVFCLSESFICWHCIDNVCFRVNLEKIVNYLCAFYVCLVYNLHMHIDVSVRACKYFLLARCKLNLVFNSLPTFFFYLLDSLHRFIALQSFYQVYMHIYLF